MKVLGSLMPIMSDMGATSNLAATLGNKLCNKNRSLKKVSFHCLGAEVSVLEIPGKVSDLAHCCSPSKYVWEVELFLSLQYERCNRFCRINKGVLFFMMFCLLSLGVGFRAIITNFNEPGRKPLYAALSASKIFLMPLTWLSSSATCFTIWFAQYVTNSIPLGVNNCNDSMETVKEKPTFAQLQPTTRQDISPPNFEAALMVLRVTGVNFSLLCSAMTKVLWYLLSNWLCVYKMCEKCVVLPKPKTIET